MTLVGIDVSYYDPILDWKNYTWDFAFIKASEGTVIDQDFRQQWEAARGYTIRGAYSFFRSFVNQKLAVQKLIEYLGNDLGELPVVLDLEVHNSYISAALLALDWLKEFYRLTGIRPIVYTSPGFASDKYVRLYNYPEFAEYPLWLATYPWDKITSTWTEEMRRNKLHSIAIMETPYTFPSTIKPFPRVDFVQWTGKFPPEYVPGYPLGGKLAVDVNFYAGDMKQLFDQFKIIYVPKPKGETMIYTGRITTVTNMRSSMPGGQYLDIGDLPTGTLIVASEKLPDANGIPWYKLISATLNSQPLKTSTGKLVNETPVWCYGKNVQEDSIQPTPTEKPVFEFTISKEGYKTTTVRLEPE